MLYVDKYRPKALDDLQYHQGLSERLNSLVGVCALQRREKRS